ncbi:Aste57867_16970 [Aphanomyces stellatus]|uniref:Aste57867_16970 protein n=1 Tax=Aphanomyces stellatus TaxID=120398 RepID=A0A485L7F7_9STRA|nr:hypothetical protein As57867_016912 [Aphanomyces stellatus]VFT93732.1 Aste57867_16970 [Aphanomyces stellatus]
MSHSTALTCPYGGRSFQVRWNDSPRKNEMVATTKTTYTFVDGITGSIEVHHAAGSSGATIVAALDVSALNMMALRAADKNCEGVDAVAAYKWHIHTKWTHGDGRSSGVLSHCSLAAAGNHYDPDYACGPNSEYVGTNTCKEITPTYECTPATYAVNPLACERGDLSGKLGDMLVDAHGKITHSWVDPHYPDLHESTPEWNMMLHAVCGKATPRVVCATGITSAPSTAVIVPFQTSVVAAILFFALVGCFVLRRHPTVGRFYPTNLVVVATLALLALLVYQDVASFV